MDGRESNRVNVNTCSTDNRKPKRVTVVMCSMDVSKSKSVHKIDISVNTIEVKDTKDEPSVIDISLIKTAGHFKLFKCGKEFFKKLVATYE